VVCARFALWPLCGGRLLILWAADFGSVAQHKKPADSVVGSCVVCLRQVVASVVQLRRGPGLSRGPQWWQRARSTRLSWIWRWRGWLWCLLLWRGRRLMSVAGWAVRPWAVSGGTWELACGAARLNGSWWCGTYSGRTPSKGLSVWVLVLGWRALVVRGAAVVAVAASGAWCTCRFARSARGMWCRLGRRAPVV
jgi:hypothetical protein